MMRLHSLLLAALSVLWVAAPPLSPAHAAEPEQVFEVALAHYDQGRYAAALPYFERALQSSSSPNARLYVARCLRELGRTVEAHDHMSATVREATELAVAESRYAATRDQARTELAALDSQVAKLIVSADQNDPPARVRINGVELTGVRFGEPVAVAPGVVALDARWTDGRRGAWRLELARGQARTIGIAAPSAAAPAPDSAATAPPDDGSHDEASAEGLGAVRVAGVVTATAGLAGMVVFGVSYGLAVDKYDEIDQACGGTHCADSSYAAEIDDGQALETTAYVALGVGAAAILGGGLLLVFGDSTADDATAARVVPCASPHGGGFELRGVF